MDPWDLVRGTCVSQAAVSVSPDSELLPKTKSLKLKKKGSVWVGEWKQKDLSKAVLDTRIS